MRIGIDASRMNIQKKTGTEYYSQEIINQLIQLDRKNSYFLYSKRPLALDLPSNFKNVVIPLPYLWTQIGLSTRMLFDSLDLFFIPAHVIPIVHPKKVIVTCHDVAFRKYPTSYSAFGLWYLESFVKHTVSDASKIIAVSENTKKDLIEIYQCSPEKIAVIYEGYNEKLFRPIKNPKIIIKEPFLLFVGRIEERKNIKRLISAFSILKKSGYKLKLVLVGKPGYGYERIKQFINEQPKNVRQDIVELGYLKAEDLPHLYTRAHLFVLPSLYEGFGLPVLEAMACGCPVVCSNTSSLPEIAKEAALYFNPENSEEIAASIERVIEDKSIRESLIKKGFQNIKRFSWRKCGAETLKVLEGI